MLYPLSYVRLRGGGRRAGSAASLLFPEDVKGFEHACPPPASPSRRHPDGKVSHVRLREEGWECEGGAVGQPPSSHVEREGFLSGCIETRLEEFPAVTCTYMVTSEQVPSRPPTKKDQHVQSRSQDTIDSIVTPKNGPKIHHPSSLLNQ